MVDHNSPESYGGTKQKILVYVAVALLILGIIWIAQGSLSWVDALGVAVLTSFGYFLRDTGLIGPR